MKRYVSTRKSFKLESRVETEKYRASYRSLIHDPACRQTTTFLRRRSSSRRQGNERARWRLEDPKWPHLVARRKRPTTLSRAHFGDETSGEPSRAKPSHGSVDSVSSLRTRARRRPLSSDTRDAGIQTTRCRARIPTHSGR